MFYENSALFLVDSVAPMGGLQGLHPLFGKIAATRDSVVKKPQEEYTGT
jgi:hypothetical protein